MKKHMFNRLITMTLAACLLVPSVGATTVGAESVVSATEQAPCALYEKYTIDFENATSLSDGGVMLTSQNEKENRIAEAKEYVLSLNLGDLGYQYIEDACLNELENWQAEDSVLNSYTVLVPKSRATLYYLGTCADKDFYCAYISENVRTYQAKITLDTDDIGLEEKWANGLLDFALNFFDTTFNIVFSVFRNKVEECTEVDYETLTGLKAVPGIQVAGVTRMVYYQYEGEWLTCYFDEQGTGRPYFVLYPNKTNLPTTVNIELIPSLHLETEHYSDTDYVLGMAFSYLYDGRLRCEQINGSVVADFF